MPKATRILLVVLSSALLCSGLARGDAPEPRLLRSNSKGENLGVIEGKERESILKEFRFEKSSSSRLSTREDAWQHEDGSPVSRDFFFSADSEEETDIESRSDTPRLISLRHRTETMKESR